MYSLVRHIVSAAGCDVLQSDKAGNELDFFDAFILCSATNYSTGSGRFALKAQLAVSFWVEKSNLIWNSSISRRSRHS